MVSNTGWNIEAGPLMTFSTCWYAVWYFERFLEIVGTLLQLPIGLAL